MFTFWCDLSAPLDTRIGFVDEASALLGVNGLCGRQRFRRVAP